MVDLRGGDQRIPVETGSDVNGNMNHSPAGELVNLTICAAYNALYLNIL